MADLFATVYNPDVLSCLANLSNDEVFTPPELANEVLDMLPESLWVSTTARFLDPCSKSGVFLREIAKRLIRGQLPDFEWRTSQIDAKRIAGEPLDGSDEAYLFRLQKVLDHIFREQIHGIGITELTSLMTRRSVYCSKWANSPYSVTQFPDTAGNIRFRNVQHTWEGTKGKERCRWCGASREELEKDRNSNETYAYELIHTAHPERIFPNMQFDVIIGNPPYQLNDGGNKASASPIYQLFVQQALKLKPRYLTMIIPSRYLAGGKGLTSFRTQMLNDRHIRKMVDYINAKDCFPQNSVGGGVNYFLWDRSYDGDCELTTVRGESRNTKVRALNEFPTFVRYNQAVTIIHKVLNQSNDYYGKLVSSRNPFGLPTSTRGHEKRMSGDLTVVSSKGRSYISRSEVLPTDAIDKYKVLISRITYEHAGEPDKKTGKLRVLSKIEVLEPGEVCTDSYLMVGPFGSSAEAENAVAYLKTKFVRFLISQTLSSINLNKDKFCFVPQVDLGVRTSDEELFEKFDFDNEEITFVDSLISPIEV